MIFGRCPADLFSSALELGAGDTWQSRLLADYTKALISTDFDPRIASQASADGIEYRVCDAERVDLEFPPESFDLVFSSNMLEHLPRPDLALSGVAKILKPDGVTIHVLPTPLWKLSQMTLHVPQMIARAIERLSEGGPRSLASGLRPGTVPDPAVKDIIPNNPKTTRAQRTILTRLLWPEPHGVSRSNAAEFRAFSRRRWVDTFSRAGLEVIEIIPGPVSSGFGFGFDRLRSVLEAVGFATEVAYVAVRAGSEPRLADHFVQPKSRMSRAPKAAP